MEKEKIFKRRNSIIGGVILTQKETRAKSRKGTEKREGEGGLVTRKKGEQILSSFEKE